MVQRENHGVSRRKALSGPGEWSHHNKLNAERTFAVSSVTRATEPLPVVPYYRAVTDFPGGRVESCSCYHGQLVAGVWSHPLISALYDAFATHRPVSLSPDIIWLTLTQGLACHINANSEELRHLLVQHEGQLKLVVRRDEFIKGSPENTWPDVFSEFSAAIREHVGDIYNLIVADFSTTGPVERAVSELVLMNAMQAYFSYELSTRCGIPAITIEGTVDDWQAIRRRVHEFRRFGVDWWVSELEPLLDHFVAAADGKVDQPFWDSIYKWHGSDGSGHDPYVSGWILKLFPYLNPVVSDDDLRSNFFSEDSRHEDVRPKSFRPNPWMTRQTTRGDGPTPDRIPHLPSRVPFVWDYRGIRFDMEFIGGLIGVRQDPHTLCLRPEIGWAIWEIGAEERKRKVGAAEEEGKGKVDEEARAKADAIRNTEPVRRFSQARDLGLRFHGLYVAALTACPSDKQLEESELKILLLEIARSAYQTDGEFRRSWDAVHGGPPTAEHAGWLWMWRKA